MFYKYIYLFLLLLSTYTKAQEQLYIHFNPQKGKIGNIYILEPSGIFVLNNRAKLQAVIIGKFKQNTIIPTINDYNKGLIPKRFQTKNIEIYTYQLKEINYANKYPVDPEFADLPVSINHFKISYYDNYYDDEVLKGKIKSIGKVKLKYFNKYYLDEKIKGSLAKIGTYKIELSNSYYKPESFGYVNKIGSVRIKYSKSHYKEALNGLVTGIGAYKISYFKDANNRHLGEFKEINGFDNSFVLLNLINTFGNSTIKRVRVGIDRQKR